jgi:hypothetical protein
VIIEGRSPNMLAQISRKTTNTLIWMIPGLLLITVGVIHYRNGTALEKAFPVPLALSLNERLPRAYYLSAVAALQKANIYDASTQRYLAEARYLANGQSLETSNELAAALSAAPSSGEGWGLYASSLVDKNPKLAAAALDQAVSVAPNEAFWIGDRGATAARLGRYLTSPTRDAIARQLWSLWSEPVLRDQIFDVLNTPGADKLVSAAYATSPGTIRQINRLVSARRRQLSKSQVRK